MSTVGVSSENDTMNGTIKRKVNDKGFGFQLRDGQAVVFDKGQGPKGPRAENVKPA
jgi:cold shock CspA family protein